MILLDTHTWVWWASSSPKLSPKAARTVSAAKTIGVSAISCWEVAMLVAKGRLAFDRDIEVWVDLSLKLPGVNLLAISPSIAVRSTRLGGGFHGDPADGILVATALEHGCPIVTKDSRIRDYPHVRAIW